MKTKITLLMPIVLLVFISNIFAVSHPANTGRDTLIMNDGKIIVGVIDDKTIDAYFKAQLNLNSFLTFISEGGSKPTKVSNQDVHYFILSGVRYISLKMVGGNKFMKVIAEGKASLYDWAGSVSTMHTQNNTVSNPGYNMQTTTVSNHDFSAMVLVVNGKTYTPQPKWLKKNFESFFGDCASLVQESKATGFDFGAYEYIVKKYNDCSAKSNGAGH
jgi:hypothetical protein